MFRTAAHTAPVVIGEVGARGHATRLQLKLDGGHGVPDELVPRHAASKFGDVEVGIQQEH